MKTQVVISSEKAMAHSGVTMAQMVLDSSRERMMEKLKEVRFWESQLSIERRNFLDEHLAPGPRFSNHEEIMRLLIQSRRDYEVANDSFERAASLLSHYDQESDPHVQECRSASREVEVQAGAEAARIVALAGCVLTAAGVFCIHRASDHFFSLVAAVMLLWSGVLAIFIVIWRHVMSTNSRRI